MTDQEQKSRPESTETLVAEERRTFLRGLGKWSQAVIGGVALGGAWIYSNPAEAWVAARGAGGSAAVGGGGGWVNRYGVEWPVDRMGAWAPVTIGETVVVRP